MSKSPKTKPVRDVSEAVLDPRINNLGSLGVALVKAAKKKNNKA